MFFLMLIILKMLYLHCFSLFLIFIIMVKYLCKIFDSEEVFIEKLLDLNELESFISTDYLFNLRYLLVDLSITPIKVPDSSLVLDVVDVDFFDDLPF